MSKPTAQGKTDVKYKTFAGAYIANGRNATRAAITAGYSEKTAEAAGSRLLRNVKVATLVESMTEKALEKSELTAERTLRELALAAYSTPVEDIKWSDKLSAIDKVMKHQGLYEKDNSQISKPVSINMIFE